MNIVMETRHIKIDYEKGLASKKELLNSELNILNGIKKLKSFSLLRKKEFTLKNKLRIQLKSLRSSVDILESGLPQYKQKVVKKEKRQVKSKEVKDVHLELEDIKMKLEKLR